MKPSDIFDEVKTKLNLDKSILSDKELNQIINSSIEMMSGHGKRNIIENSIERVKYRLKLREL